MPIRRRSSPYHGVLGNRPSTPPARQISGLLGTAHLPEPTW